MCFGLFIKIFVLKVNLFNFRLCLWLLYINLFLKFLGVLIISFLIFIECL